MTPRHHMFRVRYDSSSWGSWRGGNGREVHVRDGKVGMMDGGISSTMHDSDGMTQVTRDIHGLEQEHNPISNPSHLFWTSFLSPPTNHEINSI